MGRFYWENQKQSKTQKDIEVFVDNCSNYSYKIRPQTKQNALVERRLHEKAVDFMGEATGDMV